MDVESIKLSPSNDLSDIRNVVASTIYTIVELAAAIVHK